MRVDRRELLKMIALVTGSALVGCNKVSEIDFAKSTSTQFLAASEIALLDEIGDTIIPDTDTPGAKAARIGAFMDIMVRDCYMPPQQAVFREGLLSFQQACRKAYAKSFLQCSKDERLAFLVTLEKEANQHNAKKTPPSPDPSAPEPSNPKDIDHYYTMMKQLTLFGYFSSEIGATKALRHVTFPGRYDGAFPYKKGDRAFNDN